MVNEQSYFQLFAANFILNKCDRKDLYRFYPWSSDLTNWLDMGQATKPLSFPDIDTAAIRAKAGSGFKLDCLNGDFLALGRSHQIEVMILLRFFRSCQIQAQLSSEQGTFDAVLTSHFLDSVENALAAVEKISSVLKPGGFWMNFGSLSYVYERFRCEPSLDLSWDLLQQSITQLGFEFLELDTGIEAVYAQSDEKMASAVEQCVFFVCRKSSDAAIQ